METGGKAKILVVDDDDAIRNVIYIYLRNAGFDVLQAQDGYGALDIMGREEVALVILDIMMPGMDGLTFCRKIREYCNVPIIMVSARTEDMDKIQGLTLGADDYMTKPFNPMELIARVQANLRRMGMNGGGQAKEESPSRRVYKVRDLSIYPDTHQVLINDRPVKLTPKEFAILALLTHHPGQVYSLEQIYEAVWQEPIMDSENTVMVHIRNLREKIEENPRRPEYVKNVWEHVAQPHQRRRLASGKL